MSNTHDIETDVLIVGAGPTGMTAAMALARQGLAFHVIDRKAGPQSAPAAHVVNARSFEIWRQLGVDMDAVLALAKDPRDAGATHWVTRLGGEMLGSLPFERQGDAELEVTPTPLRNLSQHRLEPVLAREMERLGGRGVQWSSTWQSSVEDADGVTSVVACADGTAQRVRSRWVIAADGAGSPVRKSLGIACSGPDRIQAFVMVHFGADLRGLVGALPGVLYWVTDPAVQGTFVAHDIEREWVFMHAFDPENDPVSGYDKARAEAMVRAAMTEAARGVPLEIRTISTWMMTSQVADRYRAGRIFLAGDAAHRFPPTGGLGLNTGVQDVHNLAWKLAAVLEAQTVAGTTCGEAGAVAQHGQTAATAKRGYADAALLDTYEAERRPVAAYNAEASLQNAMRMIEIPMTMGTNDEPAAAAASFAAMLASPEKRAAVAQAIANQATHFDMAGLQLGYRYDEGALLPDGTPAPPNDDPIRCLVPSARPGSRLPHGWLERDGRRASTLDLVAVDAMTLLVRDAEAWRTAAAGLPLEVVECTHAEDTSKWWTGIAGLADSGALLIRPDQHVAARWCAAPTDKATALAEAMRAVSRKAA